MYTGDQKEFDCCELRLYQLLLGLRFLLLQTVYTGDQKEFEQQSLSHC